MAEAKNTKKKPAKPVDDAVLEKTTELVGLDIDGIDVDFVELVKDVDEDLAATASPSQEEPESPQEIPVEENPVVESVVAQAKPQEGAESSDGGADARPIEKKPAPTTGTANPAKKTPTRPKPAEPVAATAPEVAGDDAEVVHEAVAKKKDTAPAASKNEAGAKPAPKASWWTRLKSFFRRPAPPVPSETVTEALVEPPRDYEKELKRKLAALSKVQKIRSREAQEAELLHGRLELQQDELDRVRTWVEGLERSYFWNIQKTMGANLSRAHGDKSAYEAAVESVELPERGNLVVLRQRFHKGFGIGLLSFGIPTGLLFFIPWFATATMPVWLLEFLNSQFFSVMVAGLLALTAGILGLVRRAVGNERMNWWRMIRIALSVVAIPLLVFGTSRAQEFLLEYAVPFIDRWLATALMAIAISFLFYLLGILLFYYSGWSQFSRSVTEQLTELDNVVEGYVHSQVEIKRLEALYEQTSDWLQLLAHSLYRPWKVDPDWTTSKELRMTSESFPFALRVAHAVDSETSQIANLERLIGERLMTQGWRNEAFEDTLEEIGRQMGLEATHVTPEFLDADLPHQTNNSRALIRSFFEQSAVTAHKGVVEISDETGPTKAGHARFSDNYLVEVARRRLRELIEKTQSSVLSEARPAVEQIVEDPLREIKFDSSGIDSKDTAQDWDDFLRDALGYDDVAQPPLSTMTFADEGLLAKAPESAQTHILMPERLKASAPSPASESVTIHPLADSGTGRSVELIVRLDVVGPVPFTHVRMVENAAHRPSLGLAPIDDDDSEL
ncbi:MAG: hypothetical protein K9G08_03165 [Pontimonas sp.]|nr:hypothetical protein [Pontimonas sp.]